MILAVCGGRKIKNFARLRRENLVQRVDFMLGKLFIPRTCTATVQYNKAVYSKKYTIAHCRRRTAIRALPLRSGAIQSALIICVNGVVG